MLAAALAIAVPAWASAYNPLNVISYDTWRGSSSMSVADIQAFLETQTGPLKSYACTDTVTSATPARRSSAEIIWRSAQAWNLNPKVILATLQKEQSLITVSDSHNASRLGKAMGCGVYDNDGDGAVENQYPGFTNQIWNGARKLSTYELPGTGGGQIPGGWVPGTLKTVGAHKHVEATRTAAAGGVETYLKTVKYTIRIVPANASTFALYTYTPYYPQKLFWDVYTRYFGDTQTPPRMIPVYRFRNIRNGTYFYTASEAKRYTLIRTQKRAWAFEGRAFTVDTSATANTAPLYQMYNTRTHKYLYTLSDTQRASLLKVRPKQWRFERIVCYVARETSATAPVYRLEKKATHGIVFTSSATVKHDLTTGHAPRYAYRGIAFRLDSLEATVPIGPTP
jgi:hypothetical protein